MASYTKGDTAISYTYDADGLRTSKTVNGVKHDYYYLDGKLVYEGIGTDDILYYYDSYGTFAGLQYFPAGSNGVMYYAATNMQGDVIGLYDSTGALVVSYEYDAWGKLLSVTDTTTIGIGAINPIRYRGYYYDSETGLYYLQSRYYDPETCRFINADKYVSTGQGIFGYNVFAYCNNNPIMHIDPTGESIGMVLLIIGGCTLIGGIIGGLLDFRIGSPPPSSTEPEADAIATTTAPHPISPPSSPPSKNIITSTSRKNTTTKPTAGTLNQPLSVGDRLHNIAIGASTGLLAGATFAIGAGVIGTLQLASGTAAISWLGGATGAQSASLGILAYDIFATVIAPFFGIEVEPIEWGP